MKRQTVDIHITDHAVLRYLQRRHGVDTEAVRRHLAGLVVNAAELGAVAVQVEGVRIYLRYLEGDVSPVPASVTTVAPRPGKKDAADG